MQAPPILTIQLKRFSFAPRITGGGSGNRAAMLAMMFGSGGQKLQSHVTFPDVLDISTALNRHAIKEVMTKLFERPGGHFSHCPMCREPAACTIYTASLYIMEAALARATTLRS
jgi:hypothetical protein